MIYLINIHFIPWQTFPFSEDVNTSVGRPTTLRSITLVHTFLSMPADKQYFTQSNEPGQHSMNGITMHRTVPVGFRLPFLRSRHSTIALQFPAFSVIYDVLAAPTSWRSHQSAACSPLTVKRLVQQFADPYHPMLLVLILQSIDLPSALSRNRVETNNQANQNDTVYELLRQRHYGVIYGINGATVLVQGNNDMCRKYAV